MFNWDDAKITDDDLAESYSSYVIVTLDNGSKERNQITHVEAPSHTNPEEKRLLVLNKGGRQKQTDRIVDSYGTPDGVINETVVKDTKLWVGIYIQFLELHRFKEQTVYNGLKESIPEEYIEYRKWYNSLSESDRQIRLLNQAEKDTGWDPLYEDILEVGTWRNHSQAKDVNNFAKAIHRNSEFETSSCYKNARLVIEKDRYWNNKNVKYCEGILLPKNAARIVGHGWIEHNKRIVELTLPCHTPIPPKEAIYLGTEVSRDKLQSEWNKGKCGPYILNLKDSKIA